MKDKVLVVGMDGLRFDRLLAIRPPVLGELLDTGVHGTGLLPYGEADAAATGFKGQVVPLGERSIASRTDSGPGWSSIATGVWPDKHGVVDNSFTGAEFGKFPDFLSRAKRLDPQLTTTAMFSWAALAEHGAFGADIDTRVVLDGYAITFAAGDGQIADAAELHLAEQDPDLAFVYFGDTDEVAHRLGPHCPEYTDALLAQDGYLARLLASIRSRPTYGRERWTVLVTTDHGHLDQGGHGGTSAAERTTFVLAARLGENLGGRALPEAALVDVAPTALAQLGLTPSPSWGLDGSPLAL
ncbi:alkaline phosphatase family protein [Nonomuraea typhae]|uniref:Alkaline phosphatase family protein n=1 Tax=Nonomuraea typhae TaxID=2603600 RepID=A0ABW7YPU0_9ACTN